jgi:hypothetical protein
VMQLGPGKFHGLLNHVSIGDFRSASVRFPSAFVPAFRPTTSSLGALYSETASPTGLLICACRYSGDASLYRA